MICGVCKRAHSGRTKTCDACDARNKKWRYNNPDKERAYYRAYYAKNKELIRDRQKARHNPDKARDKKLRARYGLTAADYVQMLDLQKGVCAICERAPEKHRLRVDHSHNSGKIRALLCLTCNTSLGHMKDSPELARKMAEYLEHWSKR